MRMHPRQSEAIRKVLSADTDNFVELAAAAGLKPEQDFRGAFLRGIDFSGCDLSGFDFSGSQIVECRFGGCLLGSARFDKTQFSMTDLSRAADWRSRNESEPITYTIWDPDDYFDQPASLKTIGKVLAIENGVAIVDVGRGLCRRFQAPSLQPLLERRPVAVGDTIALSEEMVEASPTYFYDTADSDPLFTWEDVESAYQDGQIVRGFIYTAVNGGFLVNMAKFKAFLPGSQVDRYSYQNIAELMNDPQPFIITGIGGMFPDDIVVSRKAAIDAAEAEMRRQMLEQCTAGDHVEGVVTATRAYGAFVDIGGLTALLPNSELDHLNRRKAEEELTIGESLPLVIKKVDIKREKLVVSRKARLPDPWNDVRAAPGDVVTGTVSSIAPYGAFVTVGEVQGLLHNSEVSYFRDNSAADYFAVGDTIEAKVIDVDFQRRRLSLSRRLLLPHPLDRFEREVPLGTVLTGEIASVAHFGIFVWVTDELVGLLHSSRLGWTPAYPGKPYPPRSTPPGRIPVRIVNVDKEKRRLELAPAEEISPYAMFNIVYPPGSAVQGMVARESEKEFVVALPGGLMATAHRAPGVETAVRTVLWKVESVDEAGGSITVSEWIWPGRASTAADE